MKVCEETPVGFQDQNRSQTKYYYGLFALTHFFILFIKLSIFYHGHMPIRFAATAATHCFNSQA